MREDKLTHKAREAIVEAQDLAGERDQQSVELDHLLWALMKQEGGVVPPLLEKIGVPTASLIRTLEEQIDRRPKVSGGEPYYSQELSKVLKAAQGQADVLTDELSELVRADLAEPLEARDLGPADFLARGISLRLAIAVAGLLLVADAKGPRR